MKRFWLAVLALCVALTAAAGAESAAWEAALSMETISGLYGQVAFALPGASVCVYEQDYPGMHTNCRQLAGSCVEDGAEFQLRSADIASLIDATRENMKASSPDVDESVVRVNALYHFAMFFPFTYDAEVQEMQPYASRSQDWVWLEGTFTYPDTPGVTYHLKAMMTGTQATGLVIEDCDHAEDALNALRFMTDGELTELHEKLTAETEVDCAGLSLAFPREPVTLERESILWIALAEDWSYLQVQYNPVGVDIGEDEAQQETFMRTAAQRAVTPFETETVNDSVLSRPAPGVLQLDGWVIDESHFGAYGPIC